MGGVHLHMRTCTPLTELGDPSARRRGADLSAASDGAGAVLAEVVAADGALLAAAEEAVWLSWPRERLVGGAGRTQVQVGRPAGRVTAATVLQI